MENSTVSATTSHLTSDDNLILSWMYSPLTKEKIQPEAELLILDHEPLQDVIFELLPKLQAEYFSSDSFSSLPKKQKQDLLYSYQWLSWALENALTVAEQKEI